MGTLLLLLYGFLGHFFAANCFVEYEDAMYPDDYEVFLENDGLFPFETEFDFPPFDTIFSSWQTLIPDIRRLAEFPPIMNVPRVQVSCDESKLTLLVDKKSFGRMLTKEELLLGDDCYSNKELPNQFVFVYDFDQCGTTSTPHNGLQAFTNSLHVNLKKSLPTLSQTPPAVHVFCIPKRSAETLNFNPHETTGSFSIQAMNPSWTDTAETNLYTRGQMVNLQVSAKTRPDQQLFIQSCFVSASPEPQTRPRHAVVLNKGCSSSLGSPNTVTRFAASSSAHVVNLMLNTSYLTSELYVHCSVFISDKGVTSGSKLCNYNAIQSRWEELSGAMEVCDCCSSKCRGALAKYLPEGTKAVISLGPLEVVDGDAGPAILDPTQTPHTTSYNSMQSDPAEDHMVSGTSVFTSDLVSSPDGVIVVSQDPSARLTLWLPGHVVTNYDTTLTSHPEKEFSDQMKQSDGPGHHDHQPASTDGAGLNSPTNKVDSNLSDEYKDDSLWETHLPPVAGWLASAQPQNAFSTEEFHSNEPGSSNAEHAQGALSLATEMSINAFEKTKPVALDEPFAEEPQNKWLATETTVKDIQSDLNPESELPQMDAAVLHEDVDDQPIIRSKLEFSKKADGSQTLSYEEEVKHPDRKGTLRRVWDEKRKRDSGAKRLHSTFLNLLSCPH
ncbi:unnamed protein product [Menidia menidia]|uniref:(Atlantic silverside) hypothetical protein n=1 Tax=Menidia menidia TaxID=238744 RepID=A0A8S4APJ9_9TELE|nr:unnamed protein product [Menidia menidia]